MTGTPNQWWDGRIFRIAAVPIGFTIDLHGLKEIIGSQAEASSTSGVISALRNMRPRPVRTLVAVMNSFIGACATRSKSISSFRIPRSGFTTGIEVVRRIEP